MLSAAVQRLVLGRVSGEERPDGAPPAACPITGLTPSTLLTTTKSGATSGGSSDGQWRLQWDHPALSAAELLGLEGKSEQEVTEAVARCGRFEDSWEALATDEPTQLLHAADVLREVALCAAETLPTVAREAKAALPSRVTLAFALLDPLAQGKPVDGGPEPSTEFESAGAPTAVAAGLQTPWAALRTRSYLAALLLLAELESALNRLDQRLVPPGEEHSQYGHRKIKNILAEPRVREALGPSRFIVLHTLIGPLHGLCLRNLCWHGFVSPAELDHTKWPHLLALVVGFGLPPEALGGASSRSPHALPAAPPDLPDSPRQHPLFPPSTAALDAATEGIDPADRSTEAVLMRDAAVLWRWARGDGPARPDERMAAVWCALALSYAAIEAGLRVRYARVNGLPHDTAAAHVDRLQITLNKVLNFTLAPAEDPGRFDSGGITPNALLDALGYGPVAALMDEFVWCDLGAIGLKGDASEVAPDAQRHPPTRNLMVHGAVRWDCDDSNGDTIVDPFVAARVLTLGLGLFGRCDTAARSALERYRPLRHPAAVLGCKLNDIQTGDGRARQTQLIPALQECAPADITKSKQPPRQALQSKVAAAVCSIEGRTVEQAGAGEEPAGVQPVVVAYCPVCSLPDEYCCHNIDPSVRVACVSRRFGELEGCPVPDLIATAEHVLEQALSHHTPTPFEQGILESETPLVAELAELGHFLRAHPPKSPPEAGSAAGKMGDSDGLRRSCPREELNKMWSLREAACGADRLLQLCGAKTLEVAARLCSGDTKIRVGSKHAHCVVAAHTSVVLMRLADVVLSIVRHQYATPDPTFVLATHLDITVGAALGLVERGHWRQGVQVAASFVSGGDPDHHKAILAKMAVKDRTKYGIRWTVLRAHVEGGSLLDAGAISLNSFAAAHHLGNEDLASVVRSGQWGKQRRWQAD